MVKTKLIELLKSLSKKDRNKLLTYHTQTRPNELEAGYLLDWICNILNGKRPKIVRTDIEADLRREYPKSRKRLNDLTSELTDFVNDFLLTKIVHRDSSLGSMVLLHYYHEHGLLKNYNGYLPKIRKELNKERDSEYYHYDYLLKQLEVMSTKDDRKRAVSPAVIDEALELYYIENKLRFACEHVGRTNIVNSTFDDSIIGYLLRERYDTIIKSGLIKMYMLTYRMITGRSNSNSIQYYQKIREELATESKKIIAKQSLLAIYRYLLNECAYQINTGKLEYAIDYVLHVKRIEKMEMLLEGKKISPVLYKNVISMNLMAQYVAANDSRNYTYSILCEWLDEFEDRYSSKINAENGEAVSVYCKVQRYIYNGAYHEANDLYSACLNTHDFYHDIACRKMHLQITCVTRPQDKEFIDSRIKAFNKLISRNEKLTERRKEYLFAFTHYIRRMLNNDSKAISSDYLLEEMKHDLPSSDYIWFEKTIKGRAS